MFSYPERIARAPACSFGHHVAVNVPGIAIVAVITWVLVIGIKESARVNNAHGGDQAGGARPLRGRGRLLHRSRELASLRAQRLEGHPSGGGHRLLRLHRLRRRLHRGRGDEGPAAHDAARHHRLAHHLHGHLRDRGRGGHRPRSLPAAQGLRSPGQGLRGGGHRMGPGHHLAGRDHLHVGGAARVPDGPAAHLLLDEPRRPAAAVVRDRPSEIPHAPRDDDPDRRGGGAGAPRSWTTTRPTTSRTSGRCSRSWSCASACSPCA